MILVVDRHSNFSPLTNSRFLNHIYITLSNFTLKKSDLTIVTNQYLKHVVESAGGRSMVLEDKIPILKKNTNKQLKGKNNLLYICSFDRDEPYEEVFNASKLINSDICIYVTGNYNKIKSNCFNTATSDNLVLLGYLSDDDYLDYLFAVDAVIVLTTWDYTLLCGAYEAVAAEKPLILSNKKDLVNYFNKGVLKTENNMSDIALSINNVIKERPTLTKEIQRLKFELNNNWILKFNSVQNTINSMLHPKNDKGV
jgi:glycosyltransferase involved in cell wall biosynthesis